MSQSKLQPSGESLHDLFISFRGVDSRDPLLSHLINYFLNSGIDAFFDENQIKAGDHIQEKLRQGIEGTPIYVIVFSENYPNSESCLWELETIVKSATEQAGAGKKILNVFYGVERDDVRLRTDLYVKQLMNYKDATESTVQRWKECFQYAAEIDEGMSANPNEDHADLCQKILQKVQQLIGPKKPPVDMQLTLRGLPNFGSSQILELVLSPSNSVCIEDCSSLDHLFRQPGRKQIEELKVRRCPMLVEIPCLGELVSLKVLIIEDCSSLKKLPDLSKLVQLEVLYITICPRLIEILGLSNLESLSSMEIRNCDNLYFVEISLVRLSKLTSIFFENCGKLEKLGNRVSENLQSENPNIHLLLGSESDDDDNSLKLSLDHEEDSKCSATSTPSSLVMATDHQFCPEDSSSSAASTHCGSDDSVTNTVLASQSIVVYPSWYSELEPADKTSAVIDFAPCHGTDLVEDRATTSPHFVTTISPEEQETFEKLNNWIHIDHHESFHSEEEEEAMSVLKHYFSSSIEMAAGSVDDLSSLASAIKVLLSDNVTSKGDAWKKFSINIRSAYFYCMTLASIKEADHETLLEKLRVEASMAETMGDVGPVSAQMEANHVVLVKAIKNDLQAEDFERVACISDDWLGRVKEQCDLLAAYVQL